MIRSVILLTFGSVLLLLAIRSLRAQRLKERYAILFFFTGLPFMVLAIWPDGILFLGDLLRIEKAATMVLCLGAFVILVLFMLLSIVSVQDRRIATLSQMVAILMERQAAAETGDSSPEHTR